MSLKLEQEITFELHAMEQTIIQFREVFSRAYENPLDRIEIIALASLLHAFYSGVENILKKNCFSFGWRITEGRCMA